jgi:hypothetical protein
MTPTLEARNAEIADRMLWKDASAPVRAECLNHLREAARAGAEAQREADAALAQAHRPKPHGKLTTGAFGSDEADQELRQEVRAEERGEEIAAECISAAIRARALVTVTATGGGTEG